MSDIGTILDAARDWRGAPMALATVISTWGSAPRPRGSHMLVHADGRMAGSVSGGCIEGDVIALAAEVIAGARAEQRTYGVSDDRAWEFGLPCGGEIAVLVQPVGPHGFPPELFDRIAEGRARGRTVSIATDLDSGMSRLTIPGVPDLLVHAYAPPRHLYIVGAVQIAQALVAIARTLDLRPTVIDPRERFLTADRFPDADRDDRWPDEALAASALGPTSAVVALSHDAKIDDPGLIAALKGEAGYVAALGSRRSHAARRERLLAAGITPEQFDRIEGPAGIDIGAIGASEIALSVAAGMIRAQRQGSA